MVSPTNFTETAVNTVNVSHISLPFLLCCSGDNCGQTLGQTSIWVLSTFLSLLWLLIADSSTNKAPSTRIRFRLKTQLFSPFSKQFASTHSVFRSSSPVHTKTQKTQIPLSVQCVFTMPVCLFDLD